MKIAVVAPSPVPFTRGGAERATSGIEAALNDLTDHECELIKLLVDERTLPGVVDAYRRFAELDLSHFDRVVVAKYPAWMVDHPQKTLLMFHPLRGLYDTYGTFHLPTEVPNPSDHVFAMLHLMEQADHRGAIDELFERFDNALADLGADHPDLVFPGPFARTVVRWLDGIALAPGAVSRHLALSQTVARRPDYFPVGTKPQVVHLPGHLPPADPALLPAADARPYLFTVSRLDGPKRIDLLIDAMAHVPGDVELRIAGTGPEREALQARAAADPRISFLGFTRNEELPALYAGARAVAFVPRDEDLGLITLEAFSQGTPVVTCADSGGPTEFVEAGVTGLVAAPEPAALGAALTRLVADPALAERLGTAGRAREAEVTWAGVVEGILGPAQELRPVLSGDGFGSAADQPRRDPSRPKVVVTATFSINDPRHGGQLRCRHLYGSLTTWADVEVVALVDPVHPAERQVLAPGLTQLVVPRSPLHAETAAELTDAIAIPVTDLVAGTHITETPLYLEALQQSVRDADVVVLAEPYLLPAIEELGLDLPVIYDAYNVEAQLKAAAYPDTPAGRTLLAQVEAIEGRAVTGSAHVTTCSRTDAAELARRYGRPVEDMTVIPNGTVVPPAVASPEERAERGARWRERYWRTGSLDARPEHLVVFFGSWHPPNLDAAELLVDIAPSMPDVLFLSVGNHGLAFLDRELPRNVVFPGMVGEHARTHLLDAADVAVNPMRSGSGTNLKLIEYLAAGVPVLSTPFGARGVDVADGVHLALAAPEAFAAGLRAVLDDPAAAAARAAAARTLVAERYGWPTLSERLAEVIRDLVPSAARQ